MRSTVFRRVGLAVALLFAVGVVVLGSATPAFAWGGVNIHAYHFRAHNNTGVDVNDAMVWCTGTAIPPIPPAGWGPPRLLLAWSSCLTPVRTGIQNQWRWVKFGPGPTMMPVSTRCWFNVDFSVRPWLVAPPGATVSTAWFHWTKGTVPVGAWRWLGFRIGSPPALYNPGQNPDGSNNKALKVTSLQFAMSSQAIPNERTTLDDPDVQAAFSASLDVPRPLITVPVESFFDISLHPSILEPVEGGRTVLAKGVVEDEYGDPVEFVVQFSIRRELPGTSSWGLLLLALVLATLGTLYFVRSRARANA